MRTRASIIILTVFLAIFVPCRSMAGPESTGQRLTRRAFGCALWVAGLGFALWGLNRQGVEQEREQNERRAEKWRARLEELGETTVPQQDGEARKLIEEYCFVERMVRLSPILIESYLKAGADFFPELAPQINQVLPKLGALTVAGADRGALVATQLIEGKVAHDEACAQLNEADRLRAEIFLAVRRLKNSSGVERLRIRDLELKSADLRSWNLP